MYLKFLFDENQSAYLIQPWPHSRQAKVLSSSKFTNHFGLSIIPSAGDSFFNAENQETYSPAKHKIH